MEKALSEFRIGQKGIVKKITAEGKIKRRLFDMGITHGTEISLVKTAPLGDPLEFTVRGYQLSLRKSEAAGVIMEINA